LGDDSLGGGNTERWAADRFTFGQAFASAAVPEPATWTFFLLGLLGYFTVKNKGLKSKILERKKRIWLYKRRE
ncbi:MAG: PEP-CTERM sorting domain-containing protein, partial [Spirochaetota bacterium]